MTTLSAELSSRLSSKQLENTLFFLKSGKLKRLEEVQEVLGSHLKLAKTQTNDMVVALAKPNQTLHWFSLMMNAGAE